MKDVVRYVVEFSAWHGSRRVRSRLRCPNKKRARDLAVWLRDKGSLIDEIEITRVVEQPRPTNGQRRRKRRART